MTEVSPQQSPGGKRGLGTLAPAGLPNWDRTPMAGREQAVWPTAAGPKDWRFLVSVQRP